MKTKKVIWVFAGGLACGIVGPIVSSTLLVIPVWIWEAFRHHMQLREFVSGLAKLSDVYKMAILWFGPTGTLLGGLLTWSLLRVKLQDKKITVTGLQIGALSGATCSIPTLFLMPLFDHGAFSFSTLVEILKVALIFYAPIGAIVGAGVGWLISRIILRFDIRES